MAKKKKPKANITCADCIHEWACSRWNVGNIHNMDATNCNARETVRESNAYYNGESFMCLRIGAMTGTMWSAPTARRK